MNSPCLLVKSIALAEKGNKCNKNRCSRPAPNFGSGPHSQSSMHDGLCWNGETARSLRLRNRNPISVALNAYDNPSPPPHLSVLNYLQMSFKNQFIGVFFSQFRQKAVKLNVRPFLQMCYIFWDGLSFNLSKLWKKAYKLVFDDVRLQIIQLIRNVWKTLNNLDYGDVCCSLLMYFIFLFSFFRWLHSTVKLPLQMISKQTAYKSRCEGVLNFHASILCTYNAILKYLWECLFNFLKYFSICLPVSITELPTPDISRLLTPFLLNIRR